MAKPTLKPSWMPGNMGPRVVEPSAGKKVNGWDIDERPPSEFFNWLFQNISDWIEYLDSVSATLEGFSAVYSRVVGIIGPGSLATHADLNSAMVGLAPGSRILVIDDLTPAAIQQITVQNTHIEFLPGRTVTKGGGTTGIRFTAPGCKITGGRFLNFSVMGDKPIQIDAAANYTRIRDCNFNNCLITVDDQSNSSDNIGEIVE